MACGVSRGVRRAAQGQSGGQIILKFGLAGAIRKQINVSVGTGARRAHPRLPGRPRYCWHRKPLCWMCIYHCRYCDDYSYGSIQGISSRLPTGRPRGAQMLTIPFTSAFSGTDIFALPNVVTPRYEQAVDGRRHPLFARNTYKRRVQKKTPR